MGIKESSQKDSLGKINTRQRPTGKLCGLVRKFRLRLPRGELLGLDYKGLAHGRNGLGVRVPQAAYRCSGEKLLGESFVPAQNNSYMFEVSKVPVWISPDDLISEMTARMAWVTDFVRVNRAYGQEKALFFCSGEHTAS